MTLEDKIEGVKDLVEALDLPAKSKVDLQSRLSVLRSEILLLQRRELEASIKVEFYANALDTFMNKWTDRLKYD